MKDFLAGICVGAATTVLVLFGCAMLSDDADTDELPGESGDGELSTACATE
ncbi:MAG TPA: hypothetical protein P5318_07420 [Candidatus Hydrogenedentes bacterium]|nr:hypothetical protein [Candidatus Hydrogenedentota bacterium]HPC15991.1 hypothetical protein [Candidatus Hydrogenedentota bacterium]HRT19945.1 hypothetical protein [Candidatus Hydrogenedentota bacterium]HRT64623.1 hypothetical protein [Candidatus Hydrogenedentota bacterium]